MTLNSLRSYLPFWRTLTPKPIQHFLILRDKVGFDAAFEAMTADDEVGEAFCEAWDQGHEDLSSGVVVTMNDLVAMVKLAKAGFAESPRLFLLVAWQGAKVSSCQVACE